MAEGVLGVIAVGIFLPPPGARGPSALRCPLAGAVAMIIWIVGENFGGILAGSSTDPNTGPLLGAALGRLLARTWHRARAAILLSASAFP